MKCPNCRTNLLYKISLENDLPAHTCSTCEGIWLDSNEYLRWLKERGPEATEQEGSEIDVPEWDTQELRLCPACGRILSRFRVLPGSRFYLDRCSHCNGVWFDKNEWDVLVSRNLHDKVNQFFTQPWQVKVRAEETRQALEALYLQKFGAEDYKRLRETREWLTSHPQHAMLLAYLQAEDPYRM